MNKQYILKIFLQSIFLGFLGVTSTVNAVVVDWTNSFLLLGSGFDNPLVRVGFNPQPEPPASEYHPPEPGLTDPTMPTLTLFDQTDPNFQVLFAIGGSEPLFINLDSSTPDRTGGYIFAVTDRTGSSIYTVNFTLSTSTGGIPDPLSWVGFNPQPEPPALGNMAGAVAFNFTFDSMSDVTLRFSIQDVTGAPLSFSAVPLPASFWLLGSGLVCLMSVMQNNRGRR